MKIGVDIDGVLTDEHQYILDRATKYFVDNNIKYKIHNDEYDSKEIFEVTEVEYNNFWKNHIFEYSKNIMCRPFASEIINKLKKEKNEIYIITSRSFTTYENEYKEKMQTIVKEWLNNNKIEYDDIIFSKEKAKICKEKNIDIMIEDKPENIESISQLIPVIVYNHAFNEKIKNINIIRCYSWYDIYSVLKQINNKECEEYE